jgi:hypothetical protein
MRWEGNKIKGDKLVEDTNMPKFYRADLHVHSRYSNKPSLWTLKKFNCPESYTSPEFIYKRARDIGMDYVTITDHNTIDGVLEIVHLPGVFISSEITAYFPEDSCKVHVVVLNITEAIFKEIMNLRKNVYELVAYLQQNSIVHFIAHPLYEMNSKLTVDSIEKMLLLFEIFEVKNGARAGRYNKTIENILSTLTSEKIEMLSNRHNIKSYGAMPWKKAVVGGSDDHSGFFIGRAYTVSPAGESIKDFISSIKNKETLAEGDDGDPLTLAHSIYGIAYRFYMEGFKIKRDNSFPFIRTLLNRFFKTESPSFVEKIKFMVRKNIPEFYTTHDGRTFEEILEIEAKRLINDTDLLKDMDLQNRNEGIFRVTSYLANRMMYIYSNRLIKRFFSMDIIDLFQSLSTIGLVHLFITPYYLAFHHQHRGKGLIREMEKRLLLADGLKAGEKIALFTDGIDELNGVSSGIKEIIKGAKVQGIEIVIITSGQGETSFKEGVMNFKSVGDLTLPEYPGLRLHFPPILDVIDYFEKGGFTGIHAATPGSLGILALLLSKLMDIPISATYYAGILRYVRGRLTDDTFLEDAAWNYMLWFYSQIREVMVPSSGIQRELIEKGLPAEKIKPMPEWVDTRLFPVRKMVDHRVMKIRIDNKAHLAKV